MDERAHLREDALAIARIELIETSLAAPKGLVPVIIIFDVVGVPVSRLVWQGAAREGRRLAIERSTHIPILWGPVLREGPWRALCQESIRGMSQH